MDTLELDNPKPPAEKPSKILELRLSLAVDPALPDRLTTHICACDECHVGTPPRFLCPAAERLVMDSLMIEVATDGSDSG